MWYIGGVIDQGKFNIRSLIEGGIMGRFKPYDYLQGLLIPVSLEEQLMPGTLEFSINRLVEKHLD